MNLTYSFIPNHQYESPLILYITTNKAHKTDYRGNQTFLTSPIGHITRPQNLATNRTLGTMILG